jgi:hypothetical protein
MRATHAADVKQQEQDDARRRQLEVRATGINAGLQWRMKRGCVASCSLQVHSTKPAAAKPKKIKWDSSGSPAAAASPSKPPALSASLAQSSAHDYLTGTLISTPLPLLKLPLNSVPITPRTPSSPSFHANSPNTSFRTPNHVHLSTDPNASGHSSRRTPFHPSPAPLPSPATVHSCARDAAAAAPPSSTGSFALPATPDVLTPSGHVAGARGTSHVRPKTAGCRVEPGLGSGRRGENRVAVAIQDANACVDLPQSCQQQQRQQQQQQEEQQHQHQNDTLRLSPPPSISSPRSLPIWQVMASSLCPSPLPPPPPPVPLKRLQKLQVSPPFSNHFNCLHPLILATPAAAFARERPSSLVNN